MNCHLTYFIKQIRCSVHNQLLLVYFLNIKIFFVIDGTACNREQQPVQGKFFLIFMNPKSVF